MQRGADVPLSRDHPDLVARARGAPLTGLRPAQLAIHAVLLGFAAISIFPLIWMVLSSFKSASEIVAIPPTLLPAVFTVANYETVFARLDFGRYFLNSALVAVAATAAVLYTSSSAGYVFAKYRFPFKEPIFLLLLSTMMIPFAVVMLPLFLVVNSFGWVNTYQGLIVPVSVSAFGIFMMRQFIESIPTELVEAARIDGASEWWVYARVILPLSLSPLAVLAIFHFSYVWDSFLWPLIVLNDSELFNLSLGLATFRGLYSTQWSYLMAASVVVLMPCLILYFIAQRFIVEGITLTGLKG